MVDIKLSEKHTVMTGQTSRLWLGTLPRGFEGIFRWDSDKGHTQVGMY